MKTFHVCRYFFLFFPNTCTLDHRFRITFTAFPVFPFLLGCTRDFVLLPSMMLYNDFVLFRLCCRYSRIFIFSTHCYWRLISWDLPLLIDTNQFKNSLKRHNERKNPIEPSHTGVTFHAVPHLCLNWRWEGCSGTSATHSENKIPFTDKNTVWAVHFSAPVARTRIYHYATTIQTIRCRPKVW